jgi:hypothetical protein
MTKKRAKSAQKQIDFAREEPNCLLFEMSVVFYGAAGGP